MDDVQALTELNLRFIQACRQGSWSMLKPILAESFAYLDGVTGEVWESDRYIKDLESGPAPDLTIDQVVIQVHGASATVSARSLRRDRRNRYIDTYERHDDGWRCVHACVWPLPTPAA